MENEAEFLKKEARALVAIPELETSAGEAAIKPRRTGPSEYRPVRDLLQTELRYIPRRHSPEPLRQRSLPERGGLHPMHDGHSLEIANRGDRPPNWRKSPRKPGSACK